LISKSDGEGKTKVKALHLELGNDKDMSLLNVQQVSRDLEQSSTMVERKPIDLSTQSKVLQKSQVQDEDL